MERIRQGACGLALVLAACHAEDADLRCRAASPADPAVYRTEIESARAAKEQSFKTADDSPIPVARRPSWKGLSFYPVDPRLRFEGTLMRKVASDTFTIVATSGARRPIREVGYFWIDLGAGREKLPVYELLDLDPQDAGHLFVPFMDATTTAETYPAGRYLEVEDKGQGRYVLDFNLAYNPLCAYGGTFACPVTPEKNRLRAAVRAGETGYERAQP
jgi:uncharacterized protein (DUF1684 family)